MVAVAGKEVNHVADTPVNLARRRCRYLRLVSLNRDSISSSGSSLPFSYITHTGPFVFKQVCRSMATASFKLASCHHGLTSARYVGGRQQHDGKKAIPHNERNQFSLKRGTAHLVQMQSLRSPPHHHPSRPLRVSRWEPSGVNDRCCWKSECSSCLHDSSGRDAPTPALLSVDLDLVSSFRDARTPASNSHRALDTPLK